MTIWLHENMSTRLHRILHMGLEKTIQRRQSEIFFTCILGSRGRAWIPPPPSSEDGKGICGEICTCSSSDILNAGNAYFTRSEPTTAIDWNYLPLDLVAHSINQASINSTSINWNKSFLPQRVMLLWSLLFIVLVMVIFGCTFLHFAVFIVDVEIMFTFFCFGVFFFSK